MPRATSKSTSGDEDQNQLDELTNGKSLRASTGSDLKNKLKSIVDFLADNELDKDKAMETLTTNGFAKEILRDVYIGSDATQAVQVLAAQAIAEVSSLTAPDFIFEGHQRKVTDVLLGQCVHLEKATKDSETYQRVFTMLERLVKTALLSYLTDPETYAENPNDKYQSHEIANNYLTKVFDICLNTLSETAHTIHDVALTSLIEDLLKSLLDDLTEVPEEVITLLLKPLSMKSKAPGGYSVVKSVVRRLDDDKVNMICRYLVKSFDKGHEALQRHSSKKSDKTDNQKSQKSLSRLLVDIRRILTTIMALGDGHRNIMTQLFPHAASKMTSDVVHLRQLVTMAVCRLFELHTSYYVEFPQVFAQTLKRFHDIDTEIRVDMVDWIVKFLPSHAEAADKLGECLSERLVDSELEVRKAAVTAVMNICTINPTLLPKVVISKSFERIRDKKPSMRSLAMKLSAKMYQEVYNKSDKVESPYNQIPTMIIEAFCLPEAEARREAEKLLLTMLLPEANEDEVLAEDHLSELASALIQLWRNLPPKSRATLSKMLVSKKVVRTCLSRFLAIKEAIKQCKKTGNESNQKLYQQEMVKVLSLLNQLCALPQGLEQLVALKDEKVFKLLHEAVTSPMKCMPLRKKILKQVAVMTEGNAKFKDLPGCIKILLNRMSFPIDSQTYKGVSSILNNAWDLRDGRYADDMASLLEVLYSAFPEVATPEVTTDTLAILSAAAVEEAKDNATALKSGKRIPLSDAVGVIPENSKRVVTLANRRSLLVHLFGAIESIKKILFGLISNNDLGMEATELSKCVKIIRRLALTTEDELIAKMCCKGIDCLLIEKGIQRSNYFNALASDVTKNIDDDDCIHRIIIAHFRILQQCILLSPQSIKHLQSSVKASSAVLKKLMNLTDKSVRIVSSHSFHNPPLAALVYRSALRAYVAFIILKKDDNTESVAKNCRSLLTYFFDRPAGLMPAVLSTDTCKAILKLGRYPSLVRVLFSMESQVNMWPIVGYSVIFHPSSEARNEIGRILHKDIMRNKLGMQFAQLVILTLLDSSKSNFTHAKERVKDIISHFRNKSWQNNIRLDSREAPAVCPEYILPMLIHLLSRCNLLDEYVPSFEPIQRVLFIFFDTMTERRPCAPFLFDLMGRLKYYDDALQPGNTNVRLICDIGMMVLKTVTNTKEVKQEPFPGTVHIPRLFKECEDRAAGNKVYIDLKKFIPIKKEEVARSSMSIHTDEDLSKSPKKSPRKKVKRSKTPERSPKKLKPDDVSPKTKNKKPSSKLSRSKKPKTG